MVTVKDFKTQIAAEFMAMDAVKKHYNLDGSETFDDYFPAVSVEGVFIYLWAFGAWVITTLFNKHRADVLADLAALKPHALRWYVTKAKAYQHGHELPKDESGQYCSDVYDTIDEKAQIVKYAVAKEVARGDTIVVSVKVAKYSSASKHTPKKLTDGELVGLKRYFANVKDAGVPISVISNDPDVMRVEMAIYYNPMLLEANGDNTALLNANGDNVVRLAIEQVIENLPFNGDCKNSDILDAVKAIEGVDVADMVSVKSKPANGEFRPVVGYCTPASGYFALETLTLTLKPYSNGNEI